MTDETYRAHPNVSRVEVIDSSGRRFVGYFNPGVFIQLQDDQRTLKVFAKERTD
jgi:hypothetical protein